MLAQDTLNKTAPTGVELTVTRAALEFVREKGNAATIWLYSRPVGAG